MPPASNKPNFSMDVLVQRQLDDMSSGNGAYLEMFLRQAKAAGFSIRIVFAPWHSFGNRPWSSIHEQFLQLSDDILWPRSLRLGSLFVSLSLRVWLRFAVRLLREIVLRLGLPVVVESYLGKPLNSAEARILAKTCMAEPRTVTVAEYSSLAPVLKLVEAPTRFAVLMHDALSDRGEQFRSQGIEPDFHEISTSEEAEWVNRADLMIYASANEMKSFHTDDFLSDAVWLRPEPQEYQRTSETGVARVVYLGTQHAGNASALNHFLAEIWPTVQEACPSATFCVAGSVGQLIQAEHKHARGLSVLGRVPDLSTLGGPDSIGIAPTLLATGVSIKVAEFLMLGMPCVAYPQAMKGFGPVLDELVLEANNPQEFANIVIQLLNDADQRRSLSERAYELTPQLLSNEEVVAALQKLAQSSLKQTDDSPSLVSAERQLAQTELRHEP